MKAFAIGDLHGCLDDTQALLHRLGLLDDQLAWAGADTQVWFLGDYVDRGPDGVGVIDLVMRLECEARAAGGRVTALLGNHDVILCNALKFGAALVPGFVRKGLDLSFEAYWLQRAGGRPKDAARLRPHHLAWLRNRPALGRFGTTLLMHADSAVYLAYGSSVREVNATIRRLLRSEDFVARDRFEEQFAYRHGFLSEGPDTLGTRTFEQVLQTYGAQRLVHGHTAIHTLLDCPAADVTAPWVYQGAAVSTWIMDWSRVGRDLPST